MRKQPVIAALVAAGCAPLLLVLFNCVRYRASPLAGALIPLMDKTEWATGYSYLKFRRVRPGMTMDEVRAIMGDCLSVVHYDGQTQWHYTRGVDGGVMSVSSHSTHVRFVSFGPDNLVAETVYDFHFD